MSVNIEVNKNQGENTTSLIRRFTKRVQGSGILPRKRKLRYHKRSASKLLAKKRRLISLSKKAKYEELLKLGKIVEKPPGRS
jgi:hypothetical protein